MKNVLELENIDKRFGGVHALRGASLSARSAEIHAICGENGAGKSTILKILSGVYPRASYDGTVRVHGQERVFETTRDAENAGIAIVHQELMLVPELSVAQNLMLGRERPGQGIFQTIDDDQMEADAAKLLARFGVERDVDPLAPVGTLGIGLQQVVEIVRALSRKASILILDEPTAALTVDESKRLFAWLRELRDAGTTCLYVSHRMDEIFDLCDRVTVLRDGKTVSTLDIEKTDVDEVVSLMVGHAVAKGKRARPVVSASDSPARRAIELKDLAVLLEDGRVAARASFSVAKGEVVALAGAMGSGRTALLSAMFGSSRVGTTGAILIDGVETAIGSPADAIENGLAFVPEDRKGRGLVLGMSVTENLTLPPVIERKATLLDHLLDLVRLVDDDEEERIAGKRIAELKIRGAASAEVATLSGGNQQKVVLGKWLESPPKVLLLDEPTRGVDIGAREEIYEIIEQLSSRGAAVVLASSDLAEVLRLAHRVFVLRQGNVIAELDGTTTTEEEIVSLATGAAAPTSASRGSARSPVVHRSSSRESQRHMEPECLL